MNSEAEAAEMILRIVFGGTAYFLKALPSMVVGGVEGGKRLFGMLQNLANKQKTEGLSKIEYIFQQEKGISVFTLPEAEMGLFKQAAEKTKRPFAAIESVESTDTPDRMITIICTGEDAPLFNSIIKQNRLHGNMAADFEHQRTEKVAEKPEPAKEPVSPEAVEQARQEKTSQEDMAKKNEEFINAVEGKDRGNKEPENPTPATEEQTENAPPSENASRKSREPTITSQEEPDIENLHSEIQKDDDAGFNVKDNPHARPSVKEHLREVTEELEKYTADPETETDRNQTVNIIMQKLQEHDEADAPAK